VNPVIRKTLNREESKIKASLTKNNKNITKTLLNNLKEQIPPINNMLNTSNPITTWRLLAHFHSKTNIKKKIILVNIIS